MLRSLSLFAIGVSLLVRSVVAQGTWTIRNGILFQPGRWGVATFVIDGLGYMAGGYTGSADLNELRYYDPEGNFWTSGADMPELRRLAAGFAVGGKGYVACGLTGTSIIHNALFAYDPVSNSWSYMADFPGPARYSATGFALNGLGYVVGGNEGSATGPYSNLMWAYDPVANQWSPRASMPGLSRMACSSFTLNGKAYVLGGRTSDQSFTNEMYAYDPVADTWSACAPVPGVGRTYAQTFELDNRGFVVAGSDQANAGLTDVWAYDPANDSWTAMATYPSAAYWGGAAFNINGRAFSGMGRYNSIISNELYEFVSPYVGIAETAAEATLVLAPNPCPPGTSVSVALPDGRQEQAFDLLVLDDLGRAVHRETLRAGSRPTVQLPDLLDGPYTIQLTSEGTVIGRGRLVVIGGR